MKYTFCFLFAAFLAFGQTPQPKPLTTQEAENAWRMVQNQSKIAERAGSIVLPIQSAVIVVEPNGFGKTVLLPFSLSGHYLFQGVTRDGDVDRLGNPWYEIMPGTTTYTSIHDTVKTMEGNQHKVPLRWINVFRLENGRVEQLQIDLDRKATISKDVFGEYQRPTGEYVLYLRGNRTDINVGIGHNAVASTIERDAFGNILAVFPVGAYIPEPGLSTITICKDGVCETDVFERSLEIPPPVPTTGTGSSGKG